MALDLTPALSKSYSLQPVPSNLIASTANGIADGTPVIQHILWVGCSDSLVSETDSLAVSRNEIFVHRNLGNLLSNADLSCQSAIEWAVELLKVNHIIICGHYDCPLLTPSMLPAKLSKSHSSASIASLKNSNSNNAYSNTTLSPSNASSDPSLKISKRQLAEISVLAEIDWLKQQPNVQAAIAERGVVVHGFVYDREAGRCVRIVEER